MNEVEIMAAYGRAAVNLEIVQNQFNEAKKAVAELLNKQKEQPKVDNA